MKHIWFETVEPLEVFLENVFRDAVMYTEHAKRKSVTAVNVIYVKSKDVAYMVLERNRNEFLFKKNKLTKNVHGSGTI